MESKNCDYGFDIYMPPINAILVLCWRVFFGETWRGIAGEYLKYDKYNWSDKDLYGNQFYGMSILDCAAVRLGFKSYVSWPLNRKG